MLTNVTNPRSLVIRKELYEKTVIRRGATIGANATIVCGVTIGLFAFIGAGAVVRCNVPDYGMMLGVPAVQRGWMSRHGWPLNFDNAGEAICSESNLRYRLKNNKVWCLDISEEERLPKDLAVGKKKYSKFKYNQS